MLLCHCRGVNDRVIECAISCGARTADDIAAACGAGARCGGCLPVIESMLQERLKDLLVDSARTA